MNISIPGTNNSNVHYRNQSSLETKQNKSETNKCLTQSRPQVRVYNDQVINSFGFYDD